jgi:hypothetical protein
MRKLRLGAPTVSSSAFADPGDFMERVSVQIAGMTASNFFKPSPEREMDAQIVFSEAGKVQRYYDKATHLVWYYYGTK